MRAILIAVVIAIVLVGAILFGLMRFNECRAAGFSIIYCVGQ